MEKTQIKNSKNAIKPIWERPIEKKWLFGRRIGIDKNYPRRSKSH